MIKAADIRCQIREAKQALNRAQEMLDEMEDDARPEEYWVKEREQAQRAYKGDCTCIRPRGGKIHEPQCRIWTLQVNNR